MSRRSNAFTVAVLDLPSWANYTALPSGTFREFTLNTPGDVGMQRASLYNWVGGAFVPDFGVRGGVCYHGGGEHSAWTDSSTTGPGQQGVYVLDCETRLYARKCYPVTNHMGVRSDGNGSPTDNWGAYIDDGSPQSKHTYNCISYMPAAWGGGSQGSFMRVSHTGGISTSRGVVAGAFQPGLAATWRFDLSKSNHTPADPSIFKLTGESTYDFGSGIASTVNDASLACIDLKRGGWWSTHRPGSGHGDRMVFTSKTGIISGPQGRSFSGGWTWAALHHFADDDIVVRLTDHQSSPGVVPVWQVFIWQADTSNGWAQATVNRQSISDLNSIGNPAYVEMGAQSPQWSSILGCFVWLDPQYPIGKQPTATIRVWKLTPPPTGQRFAGTWDATFELVHAVPGTEATNCMNLLNGNVAGDAGAVNDTYGRFIECPSLRAFVWTRDVDKPGQLVRLQGM
jgi:hypothetical protein